MVNQGAGGGFLQALLAQQVQPGFSQTHTRTDCCSLSIPRGSARSQEHPFFPGEPRAPGCLFPCAVTGECESTPRSQMRSFPRFSLLPSLPPPPPRVFSFSHSQPHGGVTKETKEKKRGTQLSTLPETRERHKDTHCHMVATVGKAPGGMVRAGMIFCDL